MSSENKDKNSNEAKSNRRKRRLNGFEQWGGYMAAKIGKLNAQFDGQEIIQKEDKQRTEIFKGVAIFVNGYTKPPADELKRLMGVHGGVYHHYYSTTKTTHVVASNLPYSKMKNLKTQTIVTVDWITESIKAGKLLPHQDFLLYTPEAVDKQKRLQFKKSDKTELDKQSLSLNENESSASFNTLLDEYDENFESTESDSTLESEINFQEETGPSLTITSPAKSISGPNSTSLQKRGIAVKAGHPDFLSEFYNNSRLHHISTAGQELKRYVQSLAESNKERHFPGRARLKKMSQEMPSTGSFPSSSSKNCKVMMHLDMDCFFVSVGLKKHPELRGLPVAVSHSKGRSGGPQDGSDIYYEAAHYTNKSQEKVSGLTSTNPYGSSSNSSEFQKLSKYSKEYGSLSEIACCSYEARKAGLRNGMLLGEALRRCPDLKTIPYDFEGYSEVSKQLYNIVASYTLDIEAVSCDELYIDCTRLLEDTKLSADQFATTLREEIQEKTGCTASAGLGPNMLIARLANKFAKPNGQFYVRDSEIDEFIKKQKVADLPGVGYTTSSKFKNSGVLTCADLQTWSLSKLQQELGPKNGQSLYNRCRGKDDRVVQMNKTRKSVSAEINYGIRFETLEDANNFISELSVEVQNRLQSIGCKGRALTLKLMARRQDAPVETAKFMGHGICDHLSKSVLLKSSTDNANIIASECVMLARTLNVKPHDYRGIGIQMSKLEEVKKETSTLTNFLNKSKTSLKEENLPFSNGVFCPKNIEIIDKPIPEKSTLKHFLNKPSSPHKPAFNANDYLPDQLDQSVLDALPDDLRKEVLDNYHASKESTNNIFPSSTSKKDPPTSSELNQSSNNIPEVKNVKPNGDKTVKTLLETPSASFNDEPDSAENIQKSKEKASLGGEVDVDEIKKLLHEWVNSTQEPLEEDMDDLKKFLMDAIDEDLGKVNLLLEFFYKLVAPLNKEWKTVYQTALYCVQQKVLQVYGSILDASTDFPT